mgnify:CR=1 FL=1|tara:strand:- start:1252 stop:1998 length:747 start_codon:yes stop_codon:yes gene_type:complete
MISIKFSAPKEYISSCEKECLPSPATLNIPKWFKSLQHHVDKFTVKGCMPFLDTLTSGYILKLPQDIRVKHNVKDEFNGNNISICDYSLGRNFTEFYGVKNINLNGIHQQTHSTFQFKGSPFEEKNLNFPVQKILNPWKIITPPGYSCLFVPPLNNKDDRFEIITGIVDTDTFTGYVNFPFTFNNKHKFIDDIFTKGTPYVQVIPFKRVQYKMKIENLDPKKTWSMYEYSLRMFRQYQNRFWNKKIYK